MDVKDKFRKNSEIRLQKGQNDLILHLHYQEKQHGI